MRWNGSPWNELKSVLKNTERLRRNEGVIEEIEIQTVEHSAV